MKIGIDFGTTFCWSACAISGSAETLLPAGENGMPSLFYYDAELGVLIGRSAGDNGMYYPGNLVRDIKMDISANKSEYHLDGKRFTKKEIVGRIIGEAAKLAQKECSKREYASQDIEGAIISVPAAFTFRELDFIRGAVTELSVLGFIREPVAAAIAYFNVPTARDEINILVYDLGGGTCDIALVRSDKGSQAWYRVIDADMRRVGGRDWDRVVVRLIKRKLKEKFNITDFDDYTEEIIHREAISIKEKLSNVEADRVQVTIAGKVYACIITREEFDGATLELLDSTMDMVEAMVFRNIGVKIDYMVCVGGSSNMPQVREALQGRFRYAQVKVFEPEKAIAYGTAIYAENFSSTGFLLDICKFSYGFRFIDHYRLHKDVNKLIIYNQIKKTGKGSLSDFNHLVEEMMKLGCDYIVLGCTELSWVAANYAVSSCCVDALAVLTQVCIKRSGKAYKE